MQLQTALSGGIGRLRFFDPKGTVDVHGVGKEPRT